jgi:hypothetical protein
MSTKLLQDLLAETAVQTGAPGAAPEVELPLDEELAMRKMAGAFQALDEEVVIKALSEQNIIVHLNRQAKTNNLAHRQALLLAKAKGDALYAKYAKYNGIRLQLRELIHRKYGSKAVARARQFMQGAVPQPMAKK